MAAKFEINEDHAGKFRFPTFPIQTEVTLLTDVGVGQKALGASSVPLVIRLASLRP
jgi:hypothetical protein